MPSQRQIDGAHDLEDGESLGARHDQRRDARRARRDMDQAAETRSTLEARPAPRPSAKVRAAT